MTAQVKVLSRAAWRPVLARVLAAPHRHTIEDMDWVAAERGQAYGPGEVMAECLAGDRLGAVFVDGAPIYAFSVGEYGLVRTLSAAALEGRERTLTKAMLRWLRSPAGRAFARGAVVGADEQEARAGYLGPWIERLGFRAYARARQDTGEALILFSHRA